MSKKNSGKFNPNKNIVLSLYSFPLLSTTDTTPRRTFSFSTRLKQKITKSMNSLEYITPVNLLLIGFFLGGIFSLATFLVLAKLMTG